MYTENKIQEDLIILSSYTQQVKLTSEVAYKSVEFDKRDKINISNISNIFNKEVKINIPRSRRFDLIYKDIKAKSLFIIELKKEIITAKTISEIIGERGYLEIIEKIKEEGIEYKKLIFKTL
jgi:hypothetical protein